MPVFATSSKIPATSINFKTRTPVPEIVASTSEATTLQLEFKYLTYLTGNVSYWNAAQEIFQVLLREPRPEGLVPIYIDQSTGTFTGTNIRLGSRGDSYYEYLAKQWLQTGETEKTYKKEWETAVLGIRKHLLGISSPNGLLYVGERANGLQGPLSPKMDHLVCFLPGTLAIAATRGRRVTPKLKLSTRERMDLDLAEELLKGAFIVHLHY